MVGARVRLPPCPRAVPTEVAWASAPCPLGAGQEQEALAPFHAQKGVGWGQPRGGGEGEDPCEPRGEPHGQD